MIFCISAGVLGLVNSTSDKEIFRSPDDTSFDGMDVLKKGSYSDSRSEDFSYEGDFTVTYGQLLGDAHQVNAVLGAAFRENKSETKILELVVFRKVILRLLLFQIVIQKEVNRLQQILKSVA